MVKIYFLTKAVLFNGFLCLFFTLLFIHTLQGQGSGKSLSINGSNEYVEVDHDAELNLSSAFTIELWINPDAIPYGWDALVSKGVNDRPPSLWMYYNSIELWYGSGTNGLIAYTDYGTISTGKWQHIAATRSSSGTVKIYINGRLEVTQTGTPAPPTNTKDLVFGQRGDGAYFFDGGMDDIRIWDIERTQEEIQASMCQKLSGTESGLVAYYPLDEGSGSTAADLVGSLEGKLRNTPTYSTSAVPIGNESVSLYTNSWSGKTLSISSPEGDSMVLSNITGNPDGIILYRVDEKPNVTTGIINHGTNNHYFGVFKANGTSPTYLMTYHFAGNDWYKPRGNDDNLVIYMRDDNSKTSWSTPSTRLDKVNKTLSMTGTNSEYMLGDDGSPFPVELVEFYGKEKETEIELFWSTASEINTHYFLLERSHNSFDWESIAKVNAVGNSQALHTYSYQDVEPLNVTSYYRLTSVDLDGRTESFPILEITQNSPWSMPIKAIPNPADTYVVIESLEDRIVQLVDFRGSLLAEYQITAGYTKVDVSRYAKGIYYLKAEKRDGSSDVIKLLIK